MAILYYEPEARLAVGDSPEFPSEEEAKSSINSTGPLLLQEWQTYFVKFYGDSIPPFFPKPDEYYNQRCFPGRLFEIGFRNSVGLTRIGPVQVRVESRKIREELYEAMLDYIAEKYANLVFSFSTPIGQSYRKGKAGKDIAYIEYLFLKKYLLDSSPDLAGMGTLILANPHYQLSRELRYNSIEAIADVSPAMLIQIFGSANRFAKLGPGHPLAATACGRGIFEKTGKNFFPVEAIEERKHHTVDTKENRFIKFFLQSIQRRLKEMRKVLEGTAGGYLNPDIEKHLKEIDRKVGLFLADPFWQDVGIMHFLPSGSQVLQRRDGYRQLFHLYSLLQLATRCDFDVQDFKNLIETKDTPTLFEYWAFFNIKEILDSTKKSLSCKMVVSDDPQKQTVKLGIQIQYEDDIDLWFNKIFIGSSGFIPEANLMGSSTANESYSHSLRPDLVISKNDKILIFDAKFKGHRSSFYGEEEDGKISSWKEEDIDKMHTYREAIRNVHGAYILYPGEKAVVYPVHNAKGPYEGVGALPLKPEASACPVQEHIETIKKIIQDFVNES